MTNRIFLKNFHDENLNRKAPLKSFSIIFYKKMKRKTQKNKIYTKDDLVSNNDFKLMDGPFVEMNHHVNDNRIYFCEKNHIYAVNWDINKPNEFTEPDTSTSGFISCNFSPFMPFRMSRLLAKNQLNTRYAGMTAKEIRQKWNNDCQLGTKMHESFELHLNGLKEFDIDELMTQEVQQFLLFKKNILSKEIVYRTEWRFFHEEHGKKITGTADLITIDPNHNELDDTLKLIIHDYKRSWKIDKSCNDKFGLSGTPCSHLPSNNYTKYCLNMNTYKYLLERSCRNLKYKDKIYKHAIVTSMWMERFYPEVGMKECEMIKVDDFQDVIKQLFLSDFPHQIAPIDENPSDGE